MTPRKKHAKSDGMLSAIVLWELQDTLQDDSVSRFEKKFTNRKKKDVTNSILLQRVLALMLNL